MALILPFSEQHLQLICDVLGSASAGLPGAEINRLLDQAGIEAPMTDIPKRRRLYQALSICQQQDGSATRVMVFLKAAMEPGRYRENPAQFELLRGQLNQGLASAGYQIDPEGKFHVIPVIKASKEAVQRANRLRAEMQRRNAHPDVLRFCRADLLEESCCTAILQAIRCAADKVRQKGNFSGEGASLVEEAFGLDRGPKLAFNTLQTTQEYGEHARIMHLMRGLFEAFLEPEATSQESPRQMSEQDVLDVLSLLSLIHRHLDQAVPTGK